MVTGAVGLRRGAAQRTARGGVALVLLASTALVAPTSLGLGEVHAQAAPSAAPAPQPAPRLATRNVSGLVFLDDPTKVRPGGWPAVTGIDTGKAPSFARSSAFGTALKPFLGQPISIDLFNRLIAATVLAARSAGYPVVDVIVPEQDVDNGTVQVLVVVGRLGKVTAEGNKWFSSAALTGGVRLKAGDPIRSDVLNADLAWLNNNPFRSIDSVFVPGQQPGTTDIVLKTTDRFPLRTYFGFANDGTKATGEQRGSVGFSWGDAFWLGQGARIETAGFVASTLDVPDTAFMSGGSLKFSGTSTASIQNLGTINATVGDAVLVGQPINLNNGTLIVTGNLVTNGTVIGTAKFAINGTNPVLLANGTIVASGGSSDFTLTQTALNAAGAAIGAAAPITVVLTNSQAAISGTSGTGKVSLVNLNNSIGGTLQVNTGTVLNSGGIVTKDFNLVETAALSLGAHGLDVLADPGTLFGGLNTLNAGKGSTVALALGGNQFSSVQLQQVADSTVDGTGGIAIGASTLHGNLTVSMSGSGGIATTGAILADNHTATAPTNTAVVSLSDQGDGISLGADVTAATLNLTGNGSIVQTAGVLNLIGDLNVANLQAGNATLTGNTAAGSGGTLTLGKPTVQSYPIAFAMLYQPGNAPSTVASLAAISPAAGGPGIVGTSGTDGILGYARISSYDVAPDVLSAINRPLYMDLENPKTEEQLGYELRPTLQARVEGMSTEALAGIEPGGPGAFSCARLPETLALLGDNPELAQHLRDLCSRQGGRDLPEVPARPVRYFRPVR